MEESSTMEDFYAMFNVFNNVLTIFGLSSLQPFRDKNKIEYRLSYKCVVYSIGISALIIYVFYLQVTQFYPKEESLVLVILYCYITIVGTVMSILMITTAIISTNDFAQLVNDSEYFDLFILIPKSSILKWASAKQLFLSFSILTICYMWDFMSDRSNISLIKALNILMYFLFPIYNSLCISQFYITLFWLGRLYLTINQSLVGLISRHYDVSFLENDLPDFMMLGISEITRAYDAAVSCRYNRDVHQDASPCQVVRLRNLYHKTYKLTERLNTIFSARNLLLVLHHCALGTVYIYWAIRHSFPGVEIALTAVLNMYRAAIMSFVSIMWLIWPSTITINEANRTASLVHKLLAKTENLESKTELRIFSLQLIQEPVSFAPHGFFRLSNGSFLSMIGAVTSYLVILLQYHVMYVELESAKNSSSSSHP